MAELSLPWAQGLATLVIARMCSPIRLNRKLPFCSFSQRKVRKVTLGH